MKNKVKAGRRFGIVLVLGMLFGIVFWKGVGIAAEDTTQGEEQLFDINARRLSSNDVTYDIQLTISNRGVDWEGIVRMQMDIRYDSLSCAYDTVLSLPQGSTKQFVVKIPIESIEEPDKTLKVSLLDTHANVTAQKNFKRFFLDGSDAFSMGILSDSYQSLTYLDMGGDGIYYNGVELPIHLVELSQDNLIDSLDFLTYLVIDNYNTSILTDEVLEHIRKWIIDGGALIVGTGEHAEDTLSGLDFLGLECTQVNEPGTGVYSGDYDAALEQLALAELEDTINRYQGDLIMASSWGDGVVEVVSYALSDLVQPNLIIENWESYAWEVVQNINNYMRQTNTYGYGHYDSYYQLERIFHSFGNGGSRLNFSGLKWIVVLYVIFVGPILYLILKAMKKQDWYWGAVPVTVIVGILLIYFAGRGFEVINTRVYSVTVENLSAPGSDAVTYLHCYDAGHKEWDLRLADRYAYAGPVFGNYFYRNNEDKYQYRIRTEGDAVFLGMNPNRGFEDGYFTTRTSKKLETGNISSDIKTSLEWGITGTVTNGTNRDFEKFAVVYDNTLFVYENLRAGETCTLEEAVYTSNQVGYDNALDAFRQGYMYYCSDEKEDIDVIAALGTGIAAALIVEDFDGTVIFGVTRDWDKTMDDNCSETAYGCLYAVQ